jgi:hypothetical protein
MLLAIKPRATLPVQLLSDSGEKSDDAHGIMIPNDLPNLAPGRCFLLESELLPLVPRWEGDFTHDNAKAFLSLFGGHGNGAKFVASQGGVAAVVDIADYSGNDLSTSIARERLETSLRWCSLLGIDLPCNTWTRARRAPKHSRMPSALRGNEGSLLWGLSDLTEADNKKVLVGNACVGLALHLIQLCLPAGIPGYLENPRTSRVWLVPEIIALVQARKAFFVDFDMCQYGTAWKKPTRLLIWGVAQDRVALDTCKQKKGICSRTMQPHEHLTGFRSSGFATFAAQVYPSEFVAALLPQLRGL